MERNNISIRTYKRKPQIWFGTEADSFSYDFVWHLPIQMYLDGDILRFKREGNIPIFLNHQVVNEEKISIKNGDQIQIEELSITFFKEKLEVQADTECFETTLLLERQEEEYFEGFPFYKRSPRVVYQRKEERVEIKAPPRKKEMSRGSLAQLIIPPLCMMALTIAMGVFMKRGPYMCMTAGMTAITLIFSVQRYVSEKRNIKQENKDREIMYDDYLLRKRKEIKKLREEEREAIDYQTPTLPMLQDMVLEYSSRIYERSILDDDFLKVNLGYRKGESQITVSYEDKELDMTKDELIDRAKKIPKEFQKVGQIPVEIDLKKAHLGLVGNKRNIHEQLKYLLAQLTFFQSYRELQIVFIHSGAYTEDFQYMRWYPHLRLEFINVIGEIYSEQIRDQILGSIQQILKERKLKQEEEKKAHIFFPYLLFIIDEPKLILNHAIMEYLQSREMELGFSMIYTTDQQSNLPENIRTICILDNSEEAHLLLEEGERKNLRFEVQHTEGIPLEKMARTLSPLIHEQGITSQVPDKLTFFEMYGVDNTEQLEVEKRWESHSAYKSLAVPIGAKAENDFTELNLHEKAHGPHGLVAGTTGSGKSETIQTYILSLAVNFHPHEVGFLLIDYKGGGMANLFADLPHLLGTITNLDKAESMRAMASIKSELARRQRIFAEYGVNHINDYQKLFRMGKAEEPLPHLFIISDEFAELKKEQPEFMAELDSTSRIGRSLGVHLILATQKPSGVVDDQIWSNSTFRLCLKVQNAADSKEMLHTADAANITQAGRGYLQVGNNEIYELFQSAWSGAAYGTKEEQKEEDDRVYLLNALGQGEALNKDFSGTKESKQLKKSQLDVVVEHLQKVYEEEHCVKVKKTWLPSLAFQIQSPYVLDIQDSVNFQKVDLKLGIGIMDIPEEQDQTEYILDFEKNGHFLYLSSSGYGKTMLLTQIILGLSAKNAVKNLNFYLLDLGNSGMIPLKQLPHVADYMNIDHEEKIGKFQKLILEEIKERKKKLARAMVQNFSVYNETQPEPLKAIVIVIDQYEVIKELGESIENFIQKVSRDGAGLGIYLAVSTSRDGAMRSAARNNFKVRIGGFNFDESELSSFVGRSSYKLPEEHKGRALVKTDSIHVMQLYTPVPFETEKEYNQNLKELISEISQKSSEEKAKEIPVMPEELTMPMLPSYPGYEKTICKVPIGLDTDTLQVYYLPMEQAPAFILGNAKTGKTNVIKNMLTLLSDEKVYVFDNKSHELAAYQSKENVVYAGDKSAVAASLNQIKEEVFARKEEYEEAKLDDVSMSMETFVKTLPPIYVMVDMLQELYENVEEDNSRIDILEEAVRYGIYVLVTSEFKVKKMTRSKFIEMLLASREVLILGNIKDQLLFSYTGVREENRKVEFGYYHNAGVNRKVKLIFHREMK